MTSITVVIASAGRPSVCAQAIEHIQSSLLPEGAVLHGILSCPGDDDAPPTLPPNWRLITGSRGASVQRNAALDAVDPATEFVFYFDDDIVVAKNYVAEMLTLLSEKRSLVGATGTLLADGAASGSEVTYDEARSIVAAVQTDRITGSGAPIYVSSLYGCNAAVRWATASDLRFDERLPLYSWLEDLDYSRRLANRGDLARSGKAAAVHRGAASGGRVAHLRFGYSQVSNATWLRKKGTMTRMEWPRYVGAPVLKNLVLSACPSTP